MQCVLSGGSSKIEEMAPQRNNCEIRRNNTKGGGGEGERDDGASIYCMHAFVWPHVHKRCAT